MGNRRIDDTSAVEWLDERQDMRGDLRGRGTAQVGVGGDVACRLFTCFGGRWEVRQTATNVGALGFWRKVIGRYTGGRFTEAVLDNARWRGPVQTFTCPPHTAT